MRGDVHFRVERDQLILYRTTRSAKGQKKAVRGSQKTLDLRSETLKADLVAYLDAPATER